MKLSCIILLLALAPGIEGFTTDSSLLTPSKLHFGAGVNKVSKHQPPTDAFQNSNVIPTSKTIMTKKLKKYSPLFSSRQPTTYQDDQQQKVIVVTLPNWMLNMWNLLAKLITAMAAALATFSVTLTDESPRYQLEERTQPQAKSQQQQPKAGSYSFADPMEHAPDFQDSRIQIKGYTAEEDKHKTTAKRRQQQITDFQSHNFDIQGGINGYSKGETKDQTVRDKHIDPRLQEYYSQIKHEQASKEQQHVMLRTSSKQYQDMDASTLATRPKDKPISLLGLRRGRRTSNKSRGSIDNQYEAKIAPDYGKKLRNNGFRMIYQKEDPALSDPKAVFAQNPTIRTGAGASAQNYASAYMMWKGIARQTRKTDKRAITYVSATHGSHDIDDLIIHNGAAYLQDGRSVYSKPEELPAMPTLNTGSDVSSQKFALSYMLNKWLTKLMLRRNKNEEEEYGDDLLDGHVLPSSRDSTKYMLEESSHEPWGVQDTAAAAASSSSPSKLPHFLYSDC